MPFHICGDLTALIPAAGRGSRLRYDKPKILFPIAGRSILEHLIDVLEPLCGRFVLLLSPSGRAAVEHELGRLLPGRFQIAIQPEPLGMGHAIECALPELTTVHTLIVWGDQAALQPRSVAECVRAHMESGALATLPTVERLRPYIHFPRDASGRITSVLQAREGDSMPPAGESDTGLFLFQTEALKRYMTRLRESGSHRGAVTGEFNFLPIFPLIAEQPGALICPRVMTAEETVGLNSRDEAALLESVMARRAPWIRRP